MQINIDGPCHYTIFEPSSGTTKEYDLPAGQTVPLTIGPAHSFADISIGEPVATESTQTPVEETPATEEPADDPADPDPAPAPEEPAPAAPTDGHFEVYPRQKDDGAGPTGDYGWRYVTDGLTVRTIRAVSGDGFASREDAVAEIQTFLGALASGSEITDAAE